MRLYQQVTETQRRKLLEWRVAFLQLGLAIILLVVVARLTELQVVRSEELKAYARRNQFGNVTLTARRGDILTSSNTTGETSVLATNSTLDMVYVDPHEVDSPAVVAETLADTLLTEEFYSDCSVGSTHCPRELQTFFAPAFDPVVRWQAVASGTLLEPVPLTDLPVPAGAIPDITEARRLFARNIEKRIAEKFVRFVPLVYSATNVQMEDAKRLNMPGLYVVEAERLLYADPQEVEQSGLLTNRERSGVLRDLSVIVAMDQDALREMLKSRTLRYVPVMRRLPPAVSDALRLKLEESSQRTREQRRLAPTLQAAQLIFNPLRSIALIPETWRYYPDGSVGSQVVGFLNTNSEAQYGIERSFNSMLRGQEVNVKTLKGGLLTTEGLGSDPQDGDVIVLTIDRFIQKKVEELMQAALKEYGADTGQAIVMEPATGRILAMVNAPIFDANSYADVYEKEVFRLNAHDRSRVVVELYHPKTHEFIVKAYYDQLFTTEGRAQLSPEKQKEVQDVETLYPLKDVVRYYWLLGENAPRWEIFPTSVPDVWLKYKNNVGVGAYLNRTIQEIYEPGSVLKPITMSIAIDQGELDAQTVYDDKEPVKVDDFVIKNALNTYYGKVTMTNCLEFSINTCMTSVSFKLGSKLFYQSLIRFGFSRITGIELDDELPGDLSRWQGWARSKLATVAYGQGISATPLQVVTAFAALANEGKLMRPTIIDRIVHSDGTVEERKPHVVDQVITKQTAETITAMLVSTVNRGYGKTAKVKGYKIAGKTGTSQIARANGRGYETGTGSTIGSFAGFAPPENPRFVILVKFDRPTKIEFGGTSAAPVFRDIAAFLFKYYGIPPDDL